MNWFTLSLISVFALSLFYITAKKILNRDNADPRIFGGLMQLTVGTLAIPIMFIGGFTFNFTTWSVSILILMGIVYALAASFYYSGLKHTDLSESIILESSGVFWSLLLGLLFLHEGLSLNKILASILIFIAILVVTQRQKLTVKKAEIFILIGAFFYAAGAALDNYLVKFSNSSTYLSLSFLVAGTIMLSSNIFRLKKHAVPMIHDKNFRKLLLINSSFVVVSYWALFRAYELGGEISALYPITQTQTVLVPIMGVLFLRETTAIRKKLIALILTIIAFYLLRPQ